MINFNLEGQTTLPLCVPDKFLDQKFPIPISFIFGDKDWVKILEGDAPEQICSTNQFASSKVHTLPTSDHNLHMDNPAGLSTCLINDVYGLDLPVPENEKFVEMQELKAQRQELEK